MRKKIVVIIGACSDIAREIALEFSKKSFMIILYGRDKNHLNKLSKNIKSFGGESVVIIGSVTDENGINNLFEKINKKFERITHIVYTAGFSPSPNSLSKIDIADFRLAIDVNMYGFYYVVKNIINLKITPLDVFILTSGLGLKGHQSLGAYSVSKHALEGLVKSVALENLDENVRYIRICPGGVNTKMLISLFGLSTANREMLPVDVAIAITKIIDNSIIVKNGQGLRILKEGNNIFN